MNQFKFTKTWKPSDDQFDCDAVEYLLAQPIVKTQWKSGHQALFECLRRQPARLKNCPDKVKLAADLANKCGVTQTTGRVVHFIRHDPDAPAYSIERLN